MNSLRQRNTVIHFYTQMSVLIYSHHDTFLLLSELLTQFSSNCMDSHVGVWEVNLIGDLKNSEDFLPISTLQSWETSDLLHWVFLNLLFIVCPVFSSFSLAESWDIFWKRLKETRVKIAGDLLKNSKKTLVKENKLTLKKLSLLIFLPCFSEPI